MKYELRVRQSGMQRRARTHNAQHVFAKMFYVRLIEPRGARVTCQRVSRTTTPSIDHRPAHFSTAHVSRQPRTFARSRQARNSFITSFITVAYRFSYTFYEYHYSCTEYAVCVERYRRQSTLCARLAFLRAAARSLLPPRAPRPGGSRPCRRRHYGCRRPALALGAPGRRSRSSPPRPRYCSRRGRSSLGSSTRRRRSRPHSP